MAKMKTPRFPEYEWYCVNCHECLNDQSDFDDNKFTWKCTHCNYKNSISKDNLRKPYAYLKNPSAKNQIISFLVGVIRSIYGLLFRTALYCMIATVIVVVTQRTTFDHLYLGTISPRSIEDFFCATLVYSWIAAPAMLVIYAVSRRLFGRPDTKKHFIRETVYFVRDNLLYPIKNIKSLFKKTTIVDTLITIIAILIFIITIYVLVYGCQNWI